MNGSSIVHKDEKGTTSFR